MEKKVQVNVIYIFLLQVVYILDLKKTQIFCKLFEIFI